jgi:uncharacterized protein
MQFEYDPRKNRSNRKKHGISLKEAEKLWDSHQILVPAKNIVGEERFFIIGKIKSKIYTAIFTERKSKVRIISCHRADKKLERIYYEGVK